jgi:hypothetical protein
MTIKKKFLICIFVVLVLFPEFARAITIQEEEELSREFMTAVNEHYEIIHDSIITDYVNPDR